MLRLLADDLSGALDSAAPFAAVRGAVPVHWSGEVDDRRGDLAWSSETRHADADSAAATVRNLAPWLAGAALAFKKIDSGLRGHPMVEIAAATLGGGFRTTVVAPAFPAQGRVTRDGRQLVRRPDGGWQDSGIDLRAALAGLGLAAETTLPRPGGGVFVCDAAADADLARIGAEREVLARPVLWCGSAGLARVLSGAGGTPAVLEPLPRPVLLLVGTGHAATRTQLERLGTLADGIWRRDLDLPAGTSADTAGPALAALVSSVARGPRPASAVVTGGETLMLLSRALGAAALEVTGEVEPGIARSRMIGGAWSGLPLVSKSGGFGDADLLDRILAGRARGVPDA